MYSSEEQQAFSALTSDYLDKENAVRKQSADKQVEDLHGLLMFHEYRYYILNDPLISDFEYDTLYKLLEKIEAEHPELVTPESPTQRVSADLTSDFPSVEHLSPMLSLDNSYNEADLLDFDRQVRKLTGLEDGETIEYAVEPKFDGGSIALVYEGDKLIRAVTRGNGREGEEITNNARAIRSIPIRARFSEFEVQLAEVRGEVIIRKDRFRKMNKARAAEGLTLFANARNTATGGLRMKDPREVGKRDLEAFIYTLSFAEDASGRDELFRFPTHKNSLDTLQKLGFRIPERETKVFSSIVEVVAYCQEWEQKRDEYAYEIDGMVVKVNARELQEVCGATSHHPRWAIAFKFKAKQATTKLLQVEYQVGKIGSITPVAKLEPVQLAGVTVSSVSLHNEDFITGKDLRIGDTVLVERAGDVIPYIVKAMDDLRDGSEVPIKFPEYCPINDTDTPVKLERMEGEAAWRCPHCVCGAQPLQRIIFHVSKSAMDIEGLGKQIVERFYELGWLNSLADVYRLDYDKIAGLEGFGERSAENLRQSVERAKKNPIHRLLHSLSIHHLGKKASRLLAAEVDSVFDLAGKSEEDLMQIKDIGPILARNVVEYFQNEKNIALLREMEELGVNMRSTEDDKPATPSAEGPLAGKTILFTGTLQHMKRQEAQELARQAGAKNLSGVSKNLDILVVGENAGSKLTKAEKLGTVQILTENEFLDLVNHAS